MRGRQRLTAVVPLALVVALAVALGAAGCGGSPEPPPLAEPSSSATPSVSASPSAEPPVLPAAARKKTDRAVEMFARFYVAQINHASATGDLTGVDEYATPACASCRRLSAQIRGIYAAGGSIESKGWEVTGAQVLPEQPLSRKYIDMTITQSPQTVVSKQGETPKPYPGGKQALTMLLAWQGSGWAVTKMSLAR